VLSVAGYVEWGRNQRALRRGLPLPRSVLPRILMVSITAMAAVSTAIVLLSAALR
jgi:inner membrane protein YidH